MGRKNTKKKAAGDEQICRRNIGKWKCKSLSSDNKLRFCEKHYKVFEDSCRNKIKLPTKKKTSGDGCSTATGPVEIRRSRRKTVMEEDETEAIQPPTSDMECGSANVGTKRKNVQRTQGSGELDLTDSLTENPSLITSNKLRNKEMEKKKLPPDEQRCCRIGKGWRCKNFRMSHGAAADDARVPRTKFCEKHYHCYAEYYKKKRSGGGEGVGAGCSTATGPLEIRGSKRRKTAMEEDKTREIQPATSDNTSNTILEDGGSSKFGMKRKTVEKAQRSGDLKSLTKVGELESLEHYKSKCSELTVELEKQKMELEKKNVEYTTLQGKYAELETKKIAAEDEDAVKYWRNKCSDLESPVLRMEIENPTMECGVSHVSFEDSLGNPMDMLATENSNRNKHEMKWKSEVDMLSSFEEDPDLRMRAVCALYRQEISEDEKSPKGLVIDSDTLRCTTLAKFLMDGDCQGDLKKSLTELETLDSKAVDDCKKLVRRYSMHLFDIYENRKDPFFQPATTARNGDQTAKW